MKLGLRLRLGLHPALSLLLVASTGAEAGGDHHWFTDVPPGESTGRPKGRHQHGGYVEEGPDGRRQKRLWLRSERDYFHTAPAAISSVFQVDPLGQVSELPKESVGHQGFAFPLIEEGFYATYLIEREVRDGTLVTSVAKSEVLTHSCRDGRHDRKAVAERIPLHTLEAAPMEILRERLQSEDFHTELRSGDDLVFRVLLAGLPLEGASVRLVTGQGWEKSVVTDGEGRARFQMIRDYYPAWEAFERRHREKFLVLAEHQATAEGTWNGQAYQRVRSLATLPGSYLPSKSDYASYLVGLVVGLGALVFTGLAVYLYRRRRLRPYQEALVNG